MERLFYYSQPWHIARAALPGAPDRLQVQWWDDEEAYDDTPSPTQQEVDPIREAELVPSQCSWHDGLIESFVAGWPRNRLIRKEGFGMEPPFKRMDYGTSPIVEMRTDGVRTFGFFARKRVFVAHRIALKIDLLRDRTLYERHKQAVLKLFDKMTHSERDGSSSVESLIGD